MLLPLLAQFPTSRGSPLVMHRSLGVDEDQGAELPAVVRDRRRRARHVPDRAVNAKDLRSLTDGGQASSPADRHAIVWPLTSS